MSKQQFVFKRYEEKYMLTEEQFTKLMARAREYIIPDSFGESTICNIYYDTDSYELIRRSIEKPDYKEKFRTRSYGVPDKNGEVFVEIKKKFDGIVYKRRVKGNPGTTDDFINRGVRLNDNEQIQNEITWFLNFYKAYPKMFVGYERTAYYGADDREFRLTFDRNIRYRTKRLRLEDGSDGEVILEPGKVLMEVKVLAAIPGWLSKFLNEEGIYPVSFSKYGTCYKRELDQRRINYV